MSSQLFEISNLVCTYNQESNDVLVVDKLNLYKGEIVFFLGASGTGKSTLLETLGLMNNTAKKGEIKFETDDAQHDLVSVWNKESTDRIAIRKEHFGFIFQNTNLMNNLTAEENIVLSGLIKEDASIDSFDDDATRLLEKIKLKGAGFDRTAFPNNLSGGQRQRLAFARALISKSTVIFGDEPTGNLDDATAAQLMSFLQEEIKSQNKSALIVSHDKELALEFADRIVVISKEENRPEGFIKEENIIVRQEWLDDRQAAIKKISDHYKGATEKASESVQKGKRYNLKEQFKGLYFSKEYEALMGQKKINLWLLLALFVLTFITIGLANGSLEYLDRKLNSPFVKWISVTIPANRASGDEDIVKKLNESYEYKKRYGYKNLIAYSKETIYVFNESSGEFNAVNGRTVIPEKDNDLLTSYILGEENLIRGLNTGYDDDKDFSFIVTKRFLKEFGYDPETATQVFIRFKDYLGQDENGKMKSIMFKIPVEIRSIVEEIPGRNDFICTQYFAEVWNNSRMETFNTQAKTNDIRIKVDGIKDNQLKKAQEQLDEFVQANFSGSDPLVDNFQNFTEGMQNGYYTVISFEPALSSYKIADSIYNQMIDLPALKSAKEVARIYDYSYVYNVQSTPSFDNYSINFFHLDSIRPFSDFLYERFNKQGESKMGKVELDMAKVKEKDNYVFMSNVTRTISVFLIFIGIVSSALLIFNMLKLHFSQIKSNIGTLNAIGLAFNTTYKLYLRIVVRFVLISLLISAILAFLIGSLIELYLSQVMVTELDLDYFELFSFRTLMFVIVTVAASVLVTMYTIKLYLKKSPGDLIYNR